MATAEQMTAVYADHGQAVPVVRRALFALGWGQTLFNLGWFRAAGAGNLLNLIPDAERLNRAQYALLARAAALLGPEAPGQKVLDVACGLGGGSAWLAEQRPSASIVGVDLVAESIAAARTRFGALKNLRYAAGDAERLTLAPNSFQAVLCLEAAFHFRNRQRFLRETARVLAPGGTAVIVDFAWIDQRAREKTAGDPLIDLVKKLWGFEDFWTVDEYVSSARSNGLVVQAKQDWSKNVTYALQGQLDWLARLVQSRAGRGIVRATNAAFKAFSDDDFQQLVEAAAAHRVVTNHSRYLCLQLVKPK